jgi:hypothetical protein
MKQLLARCLVILYPGIHRLVSKKHVKESGQN